VRRMQQSDAIAMDAGTLAELRRTEDFNAGQRIAQRLGEAFSLSVPEAEIGYITMHLLGARFIQAARNTGTLYYDSFY